MNQIKNNISVTLNCIAFIFHKKCKRQCGKKCDKFEKYKIIFYFHYNLNFGINLLTLNYQKNIFQVKFTHKLKVVTYSAKTLKIKKLNLKLIRVTISYFPQLKIPKIRKTQIFYKNTHVKIFSN